jgi:hypothetical protein
MKYKHLFIFPVFVFLISCSQSIEKKKMLTIDKSDYSISYSAEWELKTNPQLDVLVSSPLSGATDDFAENFNVLKQDLSASNEDLQLYDSITKAQTINALGKDAILSSTNEGDHRSLVFKGPYNGRQLKWKQIYYVKNKTAYVLTYTAEEKTYDKYSAVAESIFNSFKLK